MPRRQPSPLEVTIQQPMIVEAVGEATKTTKTLVGRWPGSNVRPANGMALSRTGFAELATP